MNVFETRDRLIHDYQSYISSFIRIRDARIDAYVKQQLDAGVLWPDPLIHLNPSFEPGASIDVLVDEPILHEECRRIFRRKRDLHDAGSPLRLHRHQSDAIRMAQRIVNTGHGTNMGDWVAILREVRDSKQLRNLPDPVSFYEVLRLLVDDEVDGALQRIADRRNGQAHGKGPKGPEAIKQAFDESKLDLEVLLQAAEFLSEYPLRYVENTRRDSIQKITYYDYRDLMGDHPLVPLMHGEGEMVELEAQSLYLVNRSGKLHLLRPLLTRQQCPTCGNWATYYLDTYERKSDVTVLKPMEHSHGGDTSITRNPELSVAFRSIGLLIDKS